MKLNDIIFAFSIFIVLGIIIIPLNQFLLDFFICLNISISVLLLGISMFLNRPIDLAVLPTIILASTMFRLALNISSTRMILSTGDAGHVIKTFGTIVASGNLIVGMILFVVLTIVQFLVIVKGAERIAEVSARFTLDAMPGKQMAIDGELNMGLISPEQASAKRKDLERESALMGSMDGASKFIKGDSIAGLVMTVVNMLGGLGVGILQKGYEPSYAAQKYIILSIGDALGAQVPALLSSVATALIVTRSTSSGESLSSDTIEQFMHNPTPIMISGILFSFMGLIPGMPWYIFFTIGGAMIFAGWQKMQSGKQSEITQIEEQVQEHSKPPRSPEEMYPLLGVDALSIHVGTNLIELADPASGGKLIEEIGILRQNLTLTLGYILPPCRIADSRMISPYQYQILVRGSAITGNDLYPQRYMILKNHWDSVFNAPPPSSLAGFEPVQKEETYWVKADYLDRLIKDRKWIRPYATPIQALTYHLVETVIQNIDELFTKVDVRRVIDQVRAVDQALIDNLIPGMLSISEIRRILVNLLKEKVSIKDIHYIMERLEDLVSSVRDSDLLSEKLRMSLARQICTQNAPDKKIFSITLTPELEEQLENSLQRIEDKFVLTLDPELAKNIIDKIKDTVVATVQRFGRKPILVCNPAIRLPLARLIHNFESQLVVMSYGEIVPDFKVEVLNTIDLDSESEDNSTPESLVLKE